MRIIGDNENFVDVFSGRIYVQKSRWYGFRYIYNRGYFNMNYNYGSKTYNVLPTTLDYKRAVGGKSNSDGTLEKIIISFNRSNRDINNLQILVNKSTVTHSSNAVVNKTLLHENTVAKGHSIDKNKYYSIELLIDESVTPDDVINIMFNSSDSGSKRAYLYGAEIKFIYS